MRVLGIDVGIKRTGLALSDELGLSVRLLPNLQANSRMAAITKIKSLIIDYSVKAVVIGMPEAKTEHSKAVASRVLGLKTELEKLVAEQGHQVEVILWDESYSSKTAAIQLSHSGVKKSARKAKLDGAAAAVLVEEFLSSQARAVSA